MQVTGVHAPPQPAQPSGGDHAPPPPPPGLQSTPPPGANLAGHGVGGSINHQS